MLNSVIEFDRIVINLNSAKINTFINFNIQTAAERSGKSGFGFFAFEIGAVNADRTNNVIDFYPCVSRADQCVSERFESALRRIVFELNAAEKVVK